MEKFSHFSLLHRGRKHSHLVLKRLPPQHDFSHHKSLHQIEHLVYCESYCIWANQKTLHLKQVTLLCLDLSPGSNNLFNSPNLSYQAGKRFPFFFPKLLNEIDPLIPFKKSTWKSDAGWPHFFNSKSSTIQEQFQNFPNMWQKRMTGKRN